MDDYTSGVGVAVAIVLGLLTVCVAVFLLNKRREQSRSRNNDQPAASNDGSITVPPSSKAAKVKGAKNRQPKKHTPLSHPLLAADFKGHTGAVLSLSFELGGKYVVSCSDGAFTWTHQ